MKSPVLKVFNFSIHPANIAHVLLIFSNSIFIFIYLYIYIYIVYIYIYILYINFLNLAPSTTFLGALNSKFEKNYRTSQVSKPPSTDFTETAMERSLRCPAV